MPTTSRHDIKLHCRTIRTSEQHRTAHPLDRTHKLISTQHAETHHEVGYPDTRDSRDDHDGEAGPDLPGCVGYCIISLSGANISRAAQSWLQRHRHI